MRERKTFSTGGHKSSSEKRGERERDDVDFDREDDRPEQTVRCGGGCMVVRKPLEDD